MLQSGPRRASSCRSRARRCPADRSQGPPAGAADRREVLRGTEAEQARNLLIEGDNLQALVTLYRERGQVDLILTDPPYNTGNDFRYNDKWDEDPNDPGIGELVVSRGHGRGTPSGCGSCSRGSR